MAVTDATVGRRAKAGGRSARVPARCALQSCPRASNRAIVPMADGAMLPDWTNCRVFLDLRGAQFFAPA
jgi:hypothetical protein